MTEINVQQDVMVGGYVELNGWVMGQIGGDTRGLVRCARGGGGGEGGEGTGKRVMWLAVIRIVVGVSKVLSVAQMTNCRSIGVTGCEVGL